MPTTRRPARLHRRRQAACAALLLAGIVIGGPAWVIFAFAALLLVLDAWIPMPGRTLAEADDHFRAGVARRRRARLTRRLRGQPPFSLRVLDDDDGWASVAPRRSCGVRTIPLASIVGTVERSKATAFDAAFRPEPGAREHWKRLWVAQAHGAPLPPIAVYRVAGEHYVRDGHHRVSVARDHGCADIDADVVELLPPRAAPVASAGRTPPDAA